MVDKDGEKSNQVVKQKVAGSSNPVQVLLRDTRKDLPWLEKFIRNNREVRGDTTTA